MAEFAHQLYGITEKGARQDWTHECGHSFMRLWDRLREEPVILAFPDWKRVFHFEADASATGVGAVLPKCTLKLASYARSSTILPP